MLKNIEQAEPKENDEYLGLIKKILNEDDQESIEKFNDLKVINDLNMLLLNYDNLN